MQSTLRPARATLFGLLMIAIGFGGWWYNWHLAATEGQFYIKLTLLGPLGLFGGLLMMLRPEWAGPLRSDSTRAHRSAMFAVMGLIFVVSGIDFYFLKTRPHSPRRLAAKPARPSLAAFSPTFGAPRSSAAPEIAFLGRQYRLGSFNEKQHATWEFVPAGEQIDDWNTLLTIIDRPDARTREDLDRLAEGIMSNYKSHGGQILSAKTMGVDSGSPYNYMVAAFEEPSKQHYELNFVKMSIGPKNAIVAVYGVRIADPRDYRAKAKEFLNQNSGEVGRALSSAVLPDVSTLPRRTF